MADCFKTLGRALGKLCNGIRKKRGSNTAGNGKVAGSRISKARARTGSKAKLADLQTHLADVLKFTDEIKTNRKLVEEKQEQLIKSLVPSPLQAVQENAEVIEWIKKKQEYQQIIAQAALQLEELQIRHLEILEDVIEDSEEVVVTPLFSKRMQDWKASLQDQADAAGELQDHQLRVEILNARLDRAEGLTLRGFIGWKWLEQPLHDERKELQSMIGYLEATKDTHEFAVEKALKEALELRATRDWATTTKSLELLRCAEEYDNAKKALEYSRQNAVAYRQAYNYKAMLRKGIEAGRSQMSIDKDFLESTLANGRCIRWRQDELRRTRLAALDQGADILSNWEVWGDDPVSDANLVVAGDGKTDSEGDDWLQQEANYVEKAAPRIQAWINTLPETDPNPGISNAKRPYGLWNTDYAPSLPSEYTADSRGASYVSPSLSSAIQSSIEADDNIFGRWVTPGDSHSARDTRLNGRRKLDQIASMRDRERLFIVGKLPQDASEWERELLEAIGDTLLLSPDRPTRCAYLELLVSFP